MIDLGLETGPDGGGVLLINRPQEIMQHLPLSAAQMRICLLAIGYYDNGKNNKGLAYNEQFLDEVMAPSLIETYAEMHHIEL